MDGAILAQLMAQAAGDGADVATLRAVAEEAGELGASRALARLGLDDAAAQGDMAELRTLLRAWRDAKKSLGKSVWRAAVAWLRRGVGAVLLAGLAVKLGFGDWVK